MANAILSKSEGFRSEYSCAIVKVGTLMPVEDSDFLAKTDIFGTQIVVRKDQVNEGDILFYAANETVLNERFLSLNNLYEIACREKNANAADVKLIMDEYDEKYRNEADALRGKAKEIKSKINSLTSYADKNNKQIKKLNLELSEIGDENSPRISEINVEIADRQAKVDKATEKATKLSVDYAQVKAKIEELVKGGQHIVDKAKKLCGFFNKYGRVRCITLKNEPSFGFLFGVNEMARFCPEITELNLEEHINEEFDTVNGELFVKAFVPPVKPVSVRSRKNISKANKKLSRFDRLVGDEFRLHYETELFGKHISQLKPDTEVFVTVKLHGTSIIIGSLHVKEPKVIAFPKRMWNKVADSVGFLKKFKFIDYNIVYGPIYSSRKEIRNEYINDEVSSGFYSKDIWNEYGDIIYPYVDQGMTVYGEIVGYISGCQQPIQKHYDYGCQEGENKIMFYRITTTLSDGSRREWEVDEVYDWTRGLIERMKVYEDENWKRIHPIDILYHGTLGELYPDVDTENHWNEEFFDKFKNDKEHFGMEDFEPLCKTKVPREGVCIRIVGSEYPRCFKQKTVAFRFKEDIMMDAGEVDMEMMDSYSDVLLQN